MNQDICQRCGSVMKIVPAGVSKRTGKKYAAFKACPDRECKPSYQAGIAPQNANSSENSTSTARYEELMGAIGELSTQLTDLRFLMEDVNRKLLEK